MTSLNPPGTPQWGKISTYLYYWYDHTKMLRLTMSSAGFGTILVTSIVPNNVFSEAEVVSRAAFEVSIITLRKFHLLKPT